MKAHLLTLTCLTFLNACTHSTTQDSALSAANVNQPIASQTTPYLLEEDGSQWAYVNRLSDEFDSADIDANKWNNDPNDWGPWSWEPDNTWVDNGNLNINIRYEPHQVQRWNQKRQKVDVDLFYKSGIVRSHDSQIYGYYEARIKGVPTFPGSSPAFWIYSLNNEIKQLGLKGTQEGEATYSEVDIVELQQSEWIHGTDKQYHGPNVIDMNLHTRIIENGKEVWKRPGRYPELTKNEIIADFDVRDDFHIYGAKVTKERIEWYLDGIKVAEKPNLHWHLPMHVTLSLGLRRPHVTYRHCPNDLNRCPVPEVATAEGYPSTMQVDWVRVYK